MSEPSERMRPSASPPARRAVLPGAEAWHHSAPEAGAPGFLALHGFTGNPSSMRGLAEAMAGAGFHVELPRLPGHGTTVDDMMRDPLGGLDRRGRRRLRPARGRGPHRIVVAGLSMGARAGAVGGRSTIPRSPGWCSSTRRASRRRRGARR